MRPDEKARYGAMALIAASMVIGRSAFASPLAEFAGGARP